MLDVIGPWIASIGPLPLLFLALVRGWLLTPAAVQKVYESQEIRIAEIKSSYEGRLLEAKERELEWKDKTAEALGVVRQLQQQLNIFTESSEATAKFLEDISLAVSNSSEQQKVRKSTHVVRPGREG